MSDQEREPIELDEEADRIDEIKLLELETAGVRAALQTAIREASDKFTEHLIRSKGWWAATFKRHGLDPNTVACLEYRDGKPVLVLTHRRVVENRVIDRLIDQLMDAGMEAADKQGTGR